jgi:hypothetical protein
MIQRDDGTLTVGDRLASIEVKLELMSANISKLSTAEDTRDLEKRLLLLERDYAPRSWLIGSGLTNLVAIGALAYEILSHIH